MSLSAPVTVTKFGPKDGTTCISLLEAQERGTECVPVARCEELVLDHLGRTKEGFRPSRWGLYQLCAQLSPGLYRCLEELVLLTDDKAAAVHAAADMFNRALRLRFNSGLINKCFLIDRVGKTIEGVVSPRYRYVSNAAVYRAVRAATEGRGYLFQEAALYGRGFLLRFFDPEPRGVAPKQRFYAGLHVSNHESGRAALAAAPSVVRGEERLTFLVPTKTRNRVRHAGDKVRERMGERLVQVLLPADAATALVADFVKGVNTLHGTPLGLGRPSQKEEAIRRGEVASSLAVKANLKSGLGPRILADTILRPHDATTPRSEFSLCRADLQALTYWDLVVQLVRAAKKSPLTAREHLETTAHEVVTGHIKLR